MPVAALGGAVLVLGGCSSMDNVLGTSTAAVQQTLVGTPRAQAPAAGTADAAQATPGTRTLPDPQSDCPSVTIRSGAATYTVNGKGADNAVLDVRYQATIAETARECAVLGATMTMKVGIKGRVIVGPVGGPGEMTIPLRYALVREGPEPKTVVSKFRQVQVVIGENQPSVAFTDVDEDLTFPTPTINEIAAYIVYVGFDPQGAASQKPKVKPRVKPRQN